MSDSSMVWNPRMLEPSKPMPFSNRPVSNSLVEIEKCCHSPGRSQKRRSTISAPFFLAKSSTCFAVMVILPFEPRISDTLTQPLVL